MFRHHAKYYQMEVITSMVEEDDLISEFFYALLWLYIGLVATIIILNNFLLRSIWRPFYHLLKQVKRFRLEDSSRFEIKKTSIDEFRLLNESIEKLIKSNTDSYNSQKHFIENASHELQTPLAISINKLEALAETGKLSDTELQLLASALDNLERLTRLNKSLLLLSRIENKQYLQEEEIDFSNLIEKMRSDFSDQLEYSQLTLNIHHDGTPQPIMNADLAMILVMNLVKNAIVHNHRNGTIDIHTTNNFLSITNSGKNIPLDRARLFTRFNNEHQSEISTGLGLAIVKAIADLYSFNISYSFNGRHTITIQF